MYTRLAALLIGMQLFLGGCAKVKERGDMTLDELKTKTTALLKKQDYSEAAEYLQLIITKFPEDPKLGNYKISLANCKFNNAEYEPAYQLYENFHQYYPSDKRAEYAKYRATLCKFNQSLSFDRDQSTTEAAMRLLKSYQDIPTYQKYRTQVDKMYETCVQKMITKELYICKFYIKHGKLQAAEKRLEQARKLYGTHKDLDASLLYLECKLESKRGNQPVFNEKLDKLVKHYPDSQYTHMAENLVKKPIDFIF